MIYDVYLGPYNRDFKREVGGEKRKRERERERERKREKEINSYLFIHIFS